jgi:hypothetical protein
MGEFQPRIGITELIILVGIAAAILGGIYWVFFAEKPEE